MLRNGNKFPQSGTIGAIEGQFNTENWNIPFRAHFPNLDGYCVTVRPASS